LIIIGASVVAGAADRAAKIRECAGRRTGRTVKNSGGAVMARKCAATGAGAWQNGIHDNAVVASKSITAAGYGFHRISRPGAKCEGVARSYSAITVLADFIRSAVLRCSPLPANIIIYAKLKGICPSHAS